jgi:hypothetical protein
MKRKASCDIEDVEGTKRMRRNRLLEFYHAILDLDLVQVNASLDAGVDMEAGCRDRIGHTHISGLYTAIYTGETEVMKVLLERGANVEKTDRLKKDTPLTFACYHGHPGAVKLLLEYKANVMAETGEKRDCLFWACHPCYNYPIHQCEVLSLLFKSEQLRNNVAAIACRLLPLAAEEGSLDVVQLLLKSGANTSLRALDISIYRERYTVAVHLLRVIDINDISEERRNLLDSKLVIYNQHMELVKSSTGIMVTDIALIVTDYSFDSLIKGY